MINAQLCSKILDVVDKGLTKEFRTQKPGRMCIEAAVCYAMNHEYPHEPLCVGRTVRKFIIMLNKSRWSSDTKRAKGLRKLAIAQLGSSAIDQLKFAEYVVIQTIKRILPIIVKDTKILIFLIKQLKLGQY